MRTRLENCMNFMPSSSDQVPRQPHKILLKKKALGNANNEANELKRQRVKRFPLRCQVMQILAVPVELSSTGCSNT